MSTMHLKQISKLSLIGSTLFILVACLHDLHTSSKLLPKEKNSHILWRDDFEDGDMLGWVINDDVRNEIPHWYVDRGYLFQDTNIGDGKKGTNVIAGEADWTDYTLSANVVSTDDDYMGVVFRYQDPKNYYRFSLSTQTSKIRLEKRVDGKFISIGYLEKTWPECRYNITIDVHGDSIKVYLDQELYFAIEDSTFSGGKVGFASYHNTASFFDDITVYDTLQIVKDNSLHFDRQPYMQNVLGDSAVIMWGTDQPLNSSVEYGVNQSEILTVSSESPVTIHEVTLRNLQAGQQYYYRVRSGELLSEWYQFQAAKPATEPFSFVMYGDNRTNFLRHEEIVKGIALESPDFIINTGDVVMTGLRADWDTEYFDPLKDLITSTPVYIAIGNHENGTLYVNKGTSSPELDAMPYSYYFYSYFSFPAPEHENYYSFSYGNTFFIVIDNNKTGYPDRAFPDIAVGSAQYTWLEEQLKSSAAQDAEWLIVAGHIPVFFNGSSDVFPMNYDTTWPLFKTYGVDLFFSGHIHDYERNYVDAIYHVISGGGGGPQDIRIQNLEDIRKQRTNYHYCTVDIDGPVLTLNFKDRDQHVLDTFTIDKVAKKDTEDRLAFPKTLALSVPAENHGSVPVPLQLSVSETNDYSITIYDDKGEQVRELIRRKIIAGTHWLHWDQDDDEGFMAPKGSYVCQVKTADKEINAHFKLMD